MLNSRISVIEGHIRDTNADSLYKPLRDTFLLDTTAKKSFLDDVSRFSHVSHSVKTHTYVENHRLGEETLIIEDAHLTPTHDLSRIPADRYYSVINAQQKVMEPITAEQLEKRLKKVERQQVIVYVYDKQPKQQEPIKIQPIKDSKLQQKKVKPLSRPKSGLKVTQPKYNLFSAFDQAFNTKSCTCPANELIASQRSEANWAEVKKLQDEGFI